MDAWQLRRWAGLVIGLALLVGCGLAGRVEARVPPATAAVHVSNCRSRSDCGAPIKGGIQITFTGWACTTGFLARDLHTAKLYAVTAGHCLARSGLLALWSHHGAGIGHATLQAFRDGSMADAGAIEIDEIGVANEIYASSNEDIERVEAWAPDRDQAVGSAICRSGATSGWTCGRIVTSDVSTKIDGLPIRHSWWTDFPSATGDSGGPLFDADGRLLGIAIATTPTQTVYSTVEAIAAELNLVPCVSPGCE